MQLVPLDKIEVRRRQRSTMNSTALRELRDSILKPTGLLHPIVCWYDLDTSTWVLTAGERRLSAIRAINELNPIPTFNCSDKIVPAGLIPITPLADHLDELARFEAELDENLRREDISWQDRIRAIAALHDMRSADNPKQTLTDTGAELVDRGVVNSPAHAANKVSEARIITAHLDKDIVAKARSAEEAINLIYKAEEDKAIAALARRQMTKTTVDSDCAVRHGDLLQVLESLDPDQFDLIIADPPYGIEVSSQGFRNRTAIHHNYSDTDADAIAIAQTILAEGFRTAKRRANLFMFCDIDRFGWLKIVAARCGWVPFRRPLIWWKSESEGMFPWGSQGPRITTEYIFYATKGQRGLHISPIDVLPFKRVSKSERIHGAEKPIELIERLIECATLPGDHILDPCCGSGTSVLAARNLKRTALGIEKDEAYYNSAVARLFATEEPKP